jgi:homoserine dehydrogenase
VTRIEGVFSGTLSYIFNEFSTGSADGPAFSTVVRTARDKGYTVRLQATFYTHLSFLILLPFFFFQEPHPADDLNGADVARKLAILTRLLTKPPATAPPISLPEGYASVPTSSLIPPSLDLSSVSSGDAFLKALQAHDLLFDALRAQAAQQGDGGAVLRYVGVIDVNAENPGGPSVKASLGQYDFSPLIFFVR